MAPVFRELLSPSVSGAEAPEEADSSESVAEGSAVPEVPLALSVSVSVSDAVEVSDSVVDASVVDSDDSTVDVSVDSVVALPVVDAPVLEETVSDVLRLVPSVVGSASEVTGSVRGTFKLVSLIALLPEAVATTFVAKPDVEPHPYWKKPPSKLFL
jgi:hypothetical protein